jgi:hyperosmotically inducible protein
MDTEELQSDATYQPPPTPNPTIAAGATTLEMDTEVTQVNRNIGNVLIFVATCVFAAAVPTVSLAADTGAKAPNAMEKTGDYIGDSALTTKVKAALMAEKNLKSLPISVESTDGVVTLSGELASSAQVKQAVKVTKNVGGVDDVHNSLTVAKTK